MRILKLLVIIIPTLTHESKILQHLLLYDPIQPILLTQKLFHFGQIGLECLIPNPDKLHTLFNLRLYILKLFNDLYGFVVGCYAKDAFPKNLVAIE
jgi:hypothetical protein